MFRSFCQRANTGFKFGYCPVFCISYIILLSINIKKTLIRDLFMKYEGLNYSLYVMCAKRTSKEWVTYTYMYFKVV